METDKNSLQIIKFLTYTNLAYTNFKNFIDKGKNKEIKKNMM